MNSYQLSEMIANYTFTIAAIIGGLWTMWKWGFSEWVQHRSRMPAVDGDLHVQEYQLKNKKYALTLIALWNNRGTQPIYIDHKKTRVDVFFISPERELGQFIPKKDLGAPRYRRHPFSDMSSFILEPKTQSTLKTHYILTEGDTVLFRWRLFKDRKKHGDEEYVWTKEMLYKCGSKYEPPKWRQVASLRQAQPE